MEVKGEKDRELNWRTQQFRETGKRHKSRGLDTSL